MTKTAGVIRALALPAALACTMAGNLSAGAVAAVQVIVGPTPIVNGDAKAAGDITVVNEHLAFALAVQSAAPYGVPRGALVDLAPVTGGKIGRDRVVFADFIPNHWSAWPNTYQHVDILDCGVGEPQCERRSRQFVRDDEAARIDRRNREHQSAHEVAPWLWFHRSKGSFPLDS